MKDDLYKCEECGFTSNNWNYLDVDPATEDDPSPVISCPNCGGAMDVEDFDLYDLT